MMWMELRNTVGREVECGMCVYVVVWDETAESRRRQGRGGLGSRYNNPPLTERLLKPSRKGDCL